jgi:hypothetical protein
MTRRGQELSLFSLIWLAYISLVVHFWFVCDDAFISFRYARNWAEGNGLRFNPGGHIPVEGYSNFLWVVVGALTELLGANVALWPALVSVVCGSLLLYRVYDTMLRRLDMALPIAFMATGTLALTPPFAVWSSSGLETMAFSLLAFVTFERLVLRQDESVDVLAALSGLGLTLIRVEGVFWLLLILILAILSRRLRGAPSLRPVLFAATIALAGYAIYFGGRYAYYEDLFANTAYAKVSLSGSTILRGLKYLSVQILTFLTPLIVVPACFVALRRYPLSTALPVALMAFAFPGYAVLVSGDFMAMARLLVPALPFSTLLFAWLLQELWARPRNGSQVASVVAAAATVVVLLPAMGIHLVPKMVRAAFHFRLNQREYLSELEVWKMMANNTAIWSDKGEALRDITSPGDSMVAGAIGAVGYYSDLFIYDQAGLVSREVARRDVTGSLQKSPGHDKGVKGTEFFLPSRPTLLRVRVATRGASGELVARVRQEEAALRSEGIEDLYVIQVEPYAGDLSGIGQRYLVVWRRIDAGVEAASAWQDYEERLSEISARG